MTRVGRGCGLSNPVSFWVLAAVLVLFLFTASAPSPLYVIYEAQWDFSSITVTLVFGVYALALLVALLITGRLSDHVGRRPVLVAGLVVQLAAIAAFLLAEGVAMLYLARVLQGFATGLATGALSAWLLDLQPPERPGLGSLVAGIALMVGLAMGALVSGLLAQYAPDPLRLVYWILLGAYLVVLLAVPAFNDVVERRPGWLASMRPEVGVPPAARSLFAVSTPSLVATWALGGLYLSLGPTLAISLLGSASHLGGGLVIVGLTGTGAIVSALAHDVEPRLLVARASVALVAGIAVTLLAVASGSTALLYAGSAISGAGFGPAFSGIFRSLAPLAPPEDRAGLIASIYVVSYLALSIPAVIAGAALTRWSLADVTYVYGGVLIVLAGVTSIAVGREGRERLRSS